MSIWTDLLALHGYVASPKLARDLAQPAGAERGRRPRLAGLQPPLGVRAREPV